MVSYVDCHYNPIPVLDCERHPPGKGSFIFYAMGNRVIRDLDGVGQFLPRGASVLPLYAKFPTFGRFSIMLVRPSCYKHVGSLDDRGILSMVKDISKK